MAMVVRTSYDWCGMCMCVVASVQACAVLHSTRLCGTGRQCVWTALAGQQPITLRLHLCKYLRVADRTFKLFSNRADTDELTQRDGHSPFTLCV